jgi:hypothetical protein
MYIRISCSSLCCLEGAAESTRRKTVGFSRFSSRPSTFTVLSRSRSLPYAAPARRYWLCCAPARKTSQERTPGKPLERKRVRKTTLLPVIASSFPHSSLARLQRQSSLFPSSPPALTANDGLPRTLSHSQPRSPPHFISLSLAFPPHTTRQSLNAPHTTLSRLSYILPHPPSNRRRPAAPPTRTFSITHFPFNSHPCAFRHLEHPLSHPLAPLTPRPSCPAVPTPPAALPQTSPNTQKRACTSPSTSPPGAARRTSGPPRPSSDSSDSLNQVCRSRWRRMCFSCIRAGRGSRRTMRWSRGM